jgi:hypothetical protein
MMNANADKPAGKSGDEQNEKRDEKQAGKQGENQAGQRTDQQPDQQSAGRSREDELRHPKPAVHNDDGRSRMPERGDKSRDQSPADRPGKQPGEGEPSVG